MTLLVPANMEREGRQAGSQGSTLLSAEQLHAGSVLQSRCRLGGDRFTPGDTAELPGSAGLELPCRVLGKGAGEKQREKSRRLQEFRWRHSTACQAVCHIQAV